MPSKKIDKTKVKSSPAAKSAATKKPAEPARAERAASPAAKEKAAAKGKPVPPEEKAKKPVQSRFSEEENPDRTFELRRELVQQRSRILGEAKKEINRIISGENRQVVETALDDGDWSVVDLSEDISFKQLSTHRENLTKIDEALRKLAEGTYGICEDCGEEIDIERLKVMPFAIYCKEDQERREIIEAMERETGM